jgi:heme A synthase
VAWAVLGYTVLVILWGAYVRATGSGAGCGAHWPLCDGQLVPRAPDVEMLVEYSHRLTSGVALLAVVALFWKTRRACAPGHPARRGATWSLVFVLTEATVGAMLVLFQLVADNASMARAMFMAVHLVNTFLLLASLTLTAHWLSDGADLQLRRRPAVTAAVLATTAGLLLVGVSGAVAALGDTLFPAASLEGALRADLSASSHVLIRLRIVHPTLAVIVAGALLLTIFRLPIDAGDRRGQRALHALAALVVVQVVAGLANVLLLAPVWMQMLHLLLADAIWIAFVLVGAAALRAVPAAEGVRAVTARPVSA